MTRRWLWFYLAFCLLQLPLYYHLGKAPQGYDFAMKRAERELARPAPQAASVAADLETAQRLLAEISGTDSRRARLRLNQATASWHAGDLEAAEAHFQQAVDLFEATHGPDSWHTNAVVLRYGEFLMYCRRYPEALQRFTGGTRAVDEVQGPNSPFAVRMNSRQVMLLNYLGRSEESARLAQVVLPGLREQADKFDHSFLRQVGATLDSLTRKRLLAVSPQSDWTETLLLAARAAGEQGEATAGQE